MDIFRLDGKRALITGGSKGIGLGIAKGLTEAGAEVVLLARGEADLEKARREIESAGGRAATYAFDMMDTARIAQAYRQIIETIGPCDILVNNAGINRRNPADAQALEDWQAVLRVNLDGTFAMCQAFARERMATNTCGKIINIASLTSEATRPGIAAYTTSKGGVKMMTKALAVEWAPRGINVNAIGPGYIETDLTQPLRDAPEFDAWVKQRTPMGRWGLPRDLAYTAVFLASAASDFITGQVIYVDGGWLASL